MTLSPFFLYTAVRVRVCEGGPVAVAGMEQGSLVVVGTHCAQSRGVASRAVGACQSLAMWFCCERASPL